MTDEDFLGGVRDIAGAYQVDEKVVAADVLDAFNRYLERNVRLGPRGLTPPRMKTHRELLAEVVQPVLDPAVALVPDRNPFACHTTVQSGFHFFATELSSSFSSPNGSAAMMLSASSSESASKVISPPERSANGPPRYSGSPSSCQHEACGRVRPPRPCRGHPSSSRGRRASSLTFPGSIMV